MTQQLLQHLVFRARWRTALAVVALAAALAGPVGAEDKPNTHNMAIIGTKTIYVSHLPMFDGLNAAGTAYTSPHRFQAIFAVEFQQAGKDVGQRYVDDRKQHPKQPLYTLGPTQNFVLTRLVTPPGKPQLTSFKARVVRGHLERGGQDVPGMSNVDVVVRGAVQFHEFDPKAAKPAALQYILFGSGDELFLAHWISAPPDFDQLLSVKLTGTGFTDAELAKGVIISVPGRANTAAKRLTGTKPVAAVSGEGGTRKLTLANLRELYFEQGELAVPPTFDDTPLEKTAGF